MGDICILTDSSVQYANLSFPGRENVRILQLEYSIQNRDSVGENSLQQIGSPHSRKLQKNLTLVSPSQLKINQLFEVMLDSFDEIVAIFMTNHIYPLVEEAKKFIHSSPARNRIHVFDSSSISSGLGYLVEKAARIAKENGHIYEIAQMIRETMPKIYFMIFIPSPIYLAKAGIIEFSQAMIAEYLEISPIYSLEEGKLLPLQKVKNQKGIFDIFQEFLEEFEELKIVTLNQVQGSSFIEERMFRQYCKERFKQSTFIELPLSIPMDCLFGPTSMSLVAIEK